MDPISASPFSTITSPRDHIPRLVAAVVLGAAMGAVLTFAILTQLRPAPATQTIGVAVTDGWAHSPLTRSGIGYSAAGPIGVAVTDGWAHSPITRSGIGYSAAGPIGVAVTDGWAHSPITRSGGSDDRAALLRQLAVSYQQQGPDAEARAR
jgi:hypothetical protein